MSLFERIHASDQLGVEMKPAIKVFCVNCNKHIGYLRSDQGGIKNFIPLNGQQTTDNGLTCPLCGHVFVAFNPGTTFKTDRGYIP